MKPVLIYTGGFAPTGGVESFASDLIGSLAAEGVSTELVCWGARHHGIAALEAAGVPVFRSPWRWGCRWRWPDAVLMALAAGRIRRADTIVFAKPLSERLHLLLRRLNGRARFLMVTAYRPAELWGTVRTEPYARALATFDEIVVQTPEFESDLRVLGYRGEVRVLPYVPPAACAAPFPTSGPIRIGFLGRLVRQKNLEHLLRSVGALGEVRGPSVAPVELVLLGDGPERPRLEKLAQELGLEGRVRFEGNVERQTLPRFIDSCHLFAFTSVTEGQCLAALEILARGRPIVATPVGAFPEILASEALGSLAPARDPSEFAKVLEACIGSVQARRRTPEAVVAVYTARFPRERIVASYARALRAAGGSSTSGRALERARE